MRSPTVPATSKRTLAHQKLTHADLRDAYRWMLLSRRLDDREIVLKRQNRIYFQISGAGHEAVQVAAGIQMRKRVDWLYPYYRDRALCLTLGVSPLDMLLQAVGAGSDPASGGRQMPSHWGSVELNIVSASSPTGTQFLQAVGCAEAHRHMDADPSELTLVTAGDGTTSEGEFWESLNLACLDRLPVVYLIEDNGYAISVPVERQTAGGNISSLVRSFPNLQVVEVDGTDFLASYDAIAEAFEWARLRHGPALVHAHVTRPYSHSLSDDERLYKSESERDEESQRDPLMRFPEWLLREGVVDRNALQLIGHEVEQVVQEAVDEALKSAGPPPGSALRFLYSDAVDPTSAELAVEPAYTGDPRTMVDSINQTLAEEMRRDSSILVFGEDVADCSRDENLSLVKGKGGVFKATQGLQREFGPARCFNTPLAEAGIIGRAIGLATRGLKPVPEIQFFDYIWPAMMQIRGELATLRWRSNNGFSCPMVIRVPIGGYLQGGAVYHSQSGEVTFTHIPGLRVVMPSNATDACGLLRTALRADDPVLFLEHKKLYREPFNRAPSPGPDFTIPFGLARIVKPGDSLTIVTYGALVQKSMVASTQIERRNSGVTIEVIDLRSLAPYDWNAIADSVQRTSRAMFVYEDMLSWGYGAELAARVADELFDYLDAPVGRVAALDTWVAYNPAIENEILPQVGTIVTQAERLLRY